MARVFTTNFDFKHQNYKAIIAVKNEHEQMGVHIRIFDKELIDILGHHVIEFTGLAGYKELKLDHPQASSLLDAIHKAILDHLLKR